MIDYEKLASNCESCVTKPCQVGCPLNNDITDFIKSIKEGNNKKAYEILATTSALMSICGRVCPHMSQCEGKCVKGISYDKVEIGQLESYIGDLALDNNWSIDVPKETKYNVAVVGSGPSSLTCAYFLRKNGIGVTIYEKYDVLGGLLSHGIPDFRLPKEIVKKEIDSIINLGIDVKYNTELGKDISLDELENKFDAIFLGIGANVSNKMEIEGEDINGVYGGNELLEHHIDIDYKDKVVVVSGGGNVAMDISRLAKRSGAKKVIVLYRRSIDEMPAEKEEYESAVKDGVEFLFLTTINKIIGKDKVEKIEVLKNELIKKEGELRLSPKVIEGSNYEIECDYVIMAVGSHVDNVVDNLNLDKQKSGKIKVDLNNHTSREKVFAGGDVSGTKSTVAWASRSGRTAANSIINFLNNE